MKRNIIIIRWNKRFCSFYCVLTMISASAISFENYALNFLNIILFLLRVWFHYFYIYLLPLGFQFPSFFFFPFFIFRFLFCANDLMYEYSRASYFVTIYDSIKILSSKRFYDLLMFVFGMASNGWWLMIHLHNRWIVHKHITCTILFLTQ